MRERPIIFRIGEVVAIGAGRPKYDLAKVEAVLSPTKFKKTYLSRQKSGELNVLNGASGHYMNTI